MLGFIVSATSKTLKLHHLKIQLKIDIKKLNKLEFYSFQSISKFNTSVLFLLINAIFKTNIKMSVFVYEQTFVFLDTHP